jgi:hypothetical protein
MVQSNDAPMCISENRKKHFLYDDNEDDAGCRGGADRKDEVLRRRPSCDDRFEWHEADHARVMTCLTENGSNYKADIYVTTPEPRECHTPIKRPVTTGRSYVLTSLKTEQLASGSNYESMTFSCSSVSKFSFRFPRKLSTSGRYI